MNRTHKGFTAIEMLIVLAIIVILGGVMALMNRNAKSSLTANHIIHDFRSLKAAAASWHKDNAGSAHNHSEIVSYINSRTSASIAESSQEKGKYILHLADDGKSWYIGRELNNDAKIKQKLTAKAEAAKLLGSDKKSQYNNDSHVWVQVHSDSLRRKGS